MNTDIYFVFLCHHSHHVLNNHKILHCYTYYYYFQLNHSKNAPHNIIYCKYSHSLMHQTHKTKHEKDVHYLKASSSPSTKTRQDTKMCLFKYRYTHIYATTHSKIQQMIIIIITLSFNKSFESR